MAWLGRAREAATLANTISIGLAIVKVAKYASGLRGRGIGTCKVQCSHYYHELLWPRSQGAKPRAQVGIFPLTAAPQYTAILKSRSCGMPARCQHVALLASFHKRPQPMQPVSYSISETAVSDA